jgi:hypothetical protein
MNEYKQFAVASLNQTEKATDLANKVGRLIIAEAWLDLAEGTTQLVDHEADGAHSIMEQSLKTASCGGRQQASD